MFTFPVPSFVALRSLKSEMKNRSGMAVCELLIASSVIRSVTCFLWKNNRHDQLGDQLMTRTRENSPMFSVLLARSTCTAVVELDKARIYQQYKLDKVIS